MRLSRQNYKRIIYFLGIGLLIYGCAFSAKESGIDWDGLNYKKISCDNGKDKSSLCKPSDDDISAIGKGKR